MRVGADDAPIVGIGGKDVVSVDCQMGAHEGADAEMDDAGADAGRVVGRSRDICWQLGQRRQRQTPDWNGRRKTRRAHVTPPLWPSLIA